MKMGRIISFRRFTAAIVRIVAPQAVCVLCHHMNDQSFWMFLEIKKTCFDIIWLVFNPCVEYENGYPGGIRPPSDGAVNQIWRKVIRSACD
ncbi:hypothetical protein GIB67_007975 [Kingdonia uniflora]|uniref:Secreted protein n=1 Tax=Kingdonia uniflora TaxID=39325 RepID=A0A7J7PBR8_9MAGN|nr:hypothetical protein GIB67_007975 [Kingdonia uniflora]